MQIEGFIRQGGVGARGGECEPREGGSELNGKRGTF